jgi:hypothetical protein
MQSFDTPKTMINSKLRKTAVGGDINLDKVIVP